MQCNPPRRTLIEIPKVKVAAYTEQTSFGHAVLVPALAKRKNIFTIYIKFLGVAKI